MNSIEQNPKKYELSDLALIMSNLIRYCTTPSLVSESVSSHSYLIALMIIEFSCKYKELFSYVSREQLLIRAILHDLCESVTGDIPSPAKRLIPECTSMFVDIEECVADNLCEGRDDEFKQLLKSSINFDGDSVEELLFKTLDIFCVLIKCKNELSLGNAHYIRVIEEIKPVVSSLYNKIDEISHRATETKNSRKIYTLLRTFFDNEVNMFNISINLNIHKGAHYVI